MAGQGATLQNYNSELVKCIEELREKRTIIGREISKDEETRARIQADIAHLTKKLTDITEELNKKNATLNEYNRTIQETEAAYMKILESSQTLLSVLRRETGALSKKK